MQNFLQSIGRYGHVIMQVAMMGIQVYVAFLNGGKLSAANAAIGLLQVGLADQAYNTPPPAPPAPKS